MEMRFFLFLGWYLVVGMLVHLFLPRPPKAKEALEMAEGLHPAASGMILMATMVLWPLFVFGAIRRWLIRIF